MKRRGPSLLRHTGGAMMVMSLFMALFMIGTLYYILGVGDAVVYRRLMQDAADAGAYGAAVTAARGMNFHAFLNVVMMVTTGILLIIRSVEALLEYAIVALTAANVACMGCHSGTLATTTASESTTQRVGDVVERVVSESHRALDALHRVVQPAFPMIAQARSVVIMTRERAYDPPVQGGFVVPLLGASLPEGGSGLPVEEDEVGVLCDRVRDGVVDTLSSVDGKVASAAGEVLGIAIAGALRLGQRRTCEESIVKPPRRVLDTRTDGTEVWLGHEEFQYRAFDLGRDPHSGVWQRGEQGVRMAQGADDEGRDAVHRAHLIGRVGFAQAEYHFDGTEDKAEWLWKMNWRGRLRRFRVPRDNTPFDFSSACSKGSGDAGAMGMCEVVRELVQSGVSVH